MTQIQISKDIDRTEFIAAMRSVASSVAVVTTDGLAGRHGATVSAFCSVSADPPTVLVCLHGMSKIAKLVEENTVFSVNVLPQNGNTIADRFAGAHDADILDRFDGINCDHGLVPEIEGATSFTCSIKQTMISGSHQIFIGEVNAINGVVQNPLTYFNGAYHQVVPQSAHYEKG